MSPVLIILLLVIIHITGAFFLLAGPSRRLHGRKEYLIPVLLVPLFGPLMAVTIEVIHLMDHSGTKPVDLESMRIENDIYWKKFMRSQDEEDVIPLEEAILLSDISTRRKAMLHTFREDSFNYLDVLMTARQNEDVDTTHYATIQISKIQRQFQLELQRYSVACQDDPENPALLGEYIELLGKYIESALPEESILNRQRHIYAELLDKKLSLVPDDKKTLMRKLRNCVNLKEDYPTTLEVIQTLKSSWPEDEHVWIEILRAYVEWQDQERYLQVVSEMQRTNIDWTKQGRELVSPWVQV